MTHINESVGVAGRVPETASLRRHLRSLRGLSQALARPVDLEELFRATHRETAAALEAKTFFLGLFDEASQTVEVVRQVESGVELAGGTFPIGNGFTSQVIRTRQSQLIRHWSHDGPAVQVQYASNTPGLPESAVTAPLVFEDQVLGVISAQSYQPEAFDEDDLLVLEVIAAQVAIAIGNLRKSNRFDTQLQRRVSESDAILASMSDALLVVDAGGRLVRLNHAARQLLCVDETSVVLGQPLDSEQWGQWPLGAREVAETLAPMIDVLLHGQVPPNIEVEVGAQGERFLSFSGTPLSEVHGTVSGCVLVVRDITLRHEVERLLVERTTTLELSNKHKSDFLTSMSHELRTPLNVIIGFSEIMLDHDVTDISDEQRKVFLGHIQHSGHHLLGLVNDILDLSKVEAARMELSLERVPLQEVLVECVEVIRGMWEQKLLTVNAQCEPVDAVVTADRARLQQILFNLLSNAVKFTPTGGHISVSAQVDSAEAVVAVRDSGIGIRAEDEALIFEPFGRAKVAGPTRHQGTGLGLPLARELVELHGGRLWLSSTPGGGSCFTFTLPTAGNVGRAP
jgi:signal transduction histidine kinase